MEEDSQKKIQGFKKIVDSVRSYMNFKNITSTPLNVLI